MWFMNEIFLDKAWREFNNSIEESDKFFKEDLPSDWKANLIPKILNNNQLTKTSLPV